LDGNYHTNLYILHKVASPITHDAFNAWSALPSRQFKLTLFDFSDLLFLLSITRRT